MERVWNTRELFIKWHFKSYLQEIAANYNWRDGEGGDEDDEAVAYEKRVIIQVFPVNWYSNATNTH